MAVRIDEVISKTVKALDVLRCHCAVSAAFVFGSQITGRPRPDSDIDLAVFIENAEQWDIRRRVRLVCLVQKEAGDDIELHIFSAADLNHSDPASFAAYVVKHGVRVGPTKAA